ncbi:D-galactarolactone cycloisomerase-like [Oscarella lobularis]|uniref:D-galactarolactone cycloisomerase-like n=1 Tax=Oscarella lobularis TaxID=121494 RepID=UPI0033138772
MTTSNGERKPIVGWSEYIEERNMGVAQVIEWLGSLTIGLNPLPFSKIIAQLRANTRHVAGGIANQAIAAIENALLDIVGKSYGVPVCSLFGGPIRSEIPVYWSHCGSFRLNYHQMLRSPHTGKQTPPLRSLDDVKSLCDEVKASGHRAVKTNIFQFDPSGEIDGKLYMPGFGGGVGSPELNVPDDGGQFISRLVKQMRTFRQACGDGIGLRLDLNYNFRTEGFCQIAGALTPEALGGRGLDWLELDIESPQALARIRNRAPMPIASLESVMGRKQLLPYLHAEAVDVCIIDPLWNGVDESCKMASLCDIYEINCAAHNYHGWLGTAICAHFCAAIPNFKVLEVDVDDVPWKDDIVTNVPLLKDGVFHLPSGAGWGVDVDEEALLRYPPIRDSAKSGIWSQAGLKEA